MGRKQDGFCRGVGEERFAEPGVQASAVASSAWTREPQGADPPAGRWGPEKWARTSVGQAEVWAGSWC